ncbi:hypothetical protein [Dehalobacter sp. TeCB1]|jgi:hypothetical protein|uniref:hypothetical protein n=1 Tax=Dehalobacter sp. TeCB1 TaxID=1843715 RepID=UPI00083B32F9|nr:hypothetical protein [Dehalobacter sp. TeCB1]OCZ49729.1 hypothetical protein A7D23_02555 [Dehalobacter sp. TeCB1]
MKIKACPFCEATITKNESGKFPEFCPDCGREINPKEMLSLDTKETLNYVSPSNTIASILKGLGWTTIILGFIIGIVVASNNDSYLNSAPFWLLGLPYWIGGFISGLFMLGFAEIINLLHQINLKMK